MRSFRSPGVVERRSAAVYHPHLAVMVNQLHPFLEETLLLLMALRVPRRVIRALGLYRLFDPVVSLRQGLALREIVDDEPRALPDVLRETIREDSWMRIGLLRDKPTRLGESSREISSRRRRSNEGKTYNRPIIDTFMMSWMP